MVNFLKACVLVTVLFFMYGCAAKPVAPAEYSYSKNAINIHLQADEKLNVYQGVSHTLLVCVYQLKDLTAYTQLSGKKKGIYQLLRGKKFDPAVTYSDKIILHPGMKKQLTLDRVEGTRYLAIVTGYYNMAPEKMTRVHEVPVVLEKKSSYSLQKVNTVKNIDISLVFGAEQIQ